MSGNYHVVLEQNLDVLRHRIYPVHQGIQIQRCSLVYPEASALGVVEIRNRFLRHFCGKRFQHADCLVADLVQHRRVGQAIKVRLHTADNSVHLAAGAGIRIVAELAVHLIFDLVEILGDYLCDLFDLLVGQSLQKIVEIVQRKIRRIQHLFTHRLRKSVGGEQLFPYGAGNRRNLQVKRNIQVIVHIQSECVHMIGKACVQSGRIADPVELHAIGVCNTLNFNSAIESGNRSVLTNGDQVLHVGDRLQDSRQRHGQVKLTLRRLKNGLVVNGNLIHLLHQKAVNILCHHLGKLFDIVGVGLGIGGNLLADRDHLFGGQVAVVLQELHHTPHTDLVEHGLQLGDGVQIQELLIAAEVVHHVTDVYKVPQNVVTNGIHRIAQADTGVADDLSDLGRIRKSLLHRGVALQIQLLFDLFRHDRNQAVTDLGVVFDDLAKLGILEDILERRILQDRLQNRILEQKRDIHVCHQVGKSSLVYRIQERHHVQKLQHRVYGNHVKICGEVHIVENHVGRKIGKDLFQLRSPHIGGKDLADIVPCDVVTVVDQIPDLLGQELHKFRLCDLSVVQHPVERLGVQPDSQNPVFIGNAGVFCSRIG